jgi:hypothetical protein
MKELRLTGIMYPPPVEFGIDNRRSLQHKCEEFVSSELDVLVQELTGLPLLVEHCDTELVGIVECARKTKTGAIEIEAVIKASCVKGRAAIQDILDKKLVGLSLSHEYKLSLPAHTASNHHKQSKGIRLDLVHGTDWIALSNIDSGHTVQKRLREVSVCADPARDGCNISAIVCASTRKQNHNNINIASLTDQGNTADTRIVGVFSCSKMQTESVVATDQPGDTITEEVAAPVGLETETTHVALSEQTEVPLEVQEPQVVQPSTTDQPTVEVETVETDAQATIAMQQTMEAALARMQQMKSVIDKERQQRASDTKAQADVKEKEGIRDSEQKAKIASLEALISKTKKEELKSAKQQRDSTFERLTATLSSLECDIANTQHSPTDPKGQLLFESDIAEAAIKQLVSTTDKVQNMDSENKKLKRQHANIESNLCNFETGRVEASAANKRHQPVCTENSFLEWRATNQSALKWQVDAELQRRASSQSAAVVVNASRQKWNEPIDQDTNASKRPLTSSVYTNYPDMAKRLMQLNTGKLIDSGETIRMMQTTGSNVSNSRQTPW